MFVVARQVVPVPVQQLMAPVPPTAGSVGQIHPAGIPRETKVVNAGTLPVNTPPAAEDGPALVTVWLNVMLFPGATGFGDAELVAIKSNWPAKATVTFAVELFVFGFGSAVVLVVLAVLEITVPDAVPPATVTTRVNVVEPPAGKEVSVQRTAVVGVGQVHAVPVCVRLKKVVFAGIGSFNTTFADALGPLLVTTIV